MPIADISEYCAEPQLCEEIKAALATAAEAEAVLEIEVRWRPPGCKETRIHLLHGVPGQTDAQALLNQLERKLEGSPGLDAEGRIRCNFRRKGATSDYWSSFTRTLKFEAEGAPAEGAGEADDGEKKRLVRQNYQLVNQLIAFGNVLVGGMGAQSQFVQAITPDEDVDSWPALLAKGLPAGIAAFGALQKAKAGGEQPQQAQIPMQQDPNTGIWYAFNVQVGRWVPLPPLQAAPGPVQGQATDGGATGATPAPGGAPQSQEAQALGEGGHEALGVKARLLALAEEDPEAAKAALVALAREWGFTDPKEIAAALQMMGA